MKEVNDDDVDKLILLLQKELEENGQDEMGKSKEKSQLFHGPGFLMNIPKEFEATGKDRADAVFFSKNRPDTILFHKAECAGITVQALEQDYQEGDIIKETIRRILKQVDGKNVFYEEGQITGAYPISWFDYKSFASDGIVYNLMFLFMAGEKLIIGTFYCIFKDYDRWKPRILNMLNTIQTEEAGNERI